MYKSILWLDQLLIDRAQSAEEYIDCISAER